MTTFQTEILVPVTVTVTHYNPGRKGKLFGAPEDCYPDEPPLIEFDVTLADGTKVYCDAHGFDGDAIEAEALDVIRDEREAV